MACITAALAKPCVAKIGAKKASSSSRSAPRSVVRVVAQKQEQKVSLTENNWMANWWWNEKSKEWIINFVKFFQ